MSRRTFPSSTPTFECLACSKTLILKILKVEIVNFDCIKIVPRIVILEARFE